MYRIIDLTTGKTLAVCADRAHTLLAFLRLSSRINSNWLLRGRQLNFDLLNISGKDILFRWERDGYVWSEALQTMVPKTKKVCYLRPYQVLDEWDRSVDIRLWKDDITDINAGNWPTHHKKPEHMPRYRVDPCGWGHKYHVHRQNSASMMFQQLKQQDADVHDDKSEFNPIVDKTSVRRRVTKGELWDSYDDKNAAKWRSSKCWKDQSKSPRQWARHKSGLSRHDPRRPKYIIKSVEDMAAELDIPSSVTAKYIKESEEYPA